MSPLLGSTPADLFRFEVTETAAVANIDRRVALDDFGSGLSSFGYLRDRDADDANAYRRARPQPLSKHPAPVLAS